MENAQEVIIFRKDLLTGLENYSTAEVSDFLKQIFPKMIELFEKKDINYNGSWQKRGLLSAQLNLERKFDRLTAQFYNGTITSETNENILDTFVDLSIYQLLELYFLVKREKHVQEQLTEFLKS